MLAERALADISLRELADRVGLAKSNVLRYFDSREAIYLEVLDAEWTAWLDDLDGLADVAGELAPTLVERPLLCELISAMAGVLERNITVEFARDFKRRATANSQRLAAIVRDRVPKLSEASATHFAGAVFVIVAGLWPYARPTPAVAQVTAEMGYPPADVTFPESLREGIEVHLAGLRPAAATRDASLVVVLGMEAEFRAFVAAQGDQLRRTAYLLCRDWYAADDLVSITLTKLFRHWRRVSAADNPAAYARGVLTNAWLDERRRPWHREDPFDVLPDQPDAQVHVDASGVEERQDLIDLLQRLPAGRRAVVVLVLLRPVRGADRGPARHHHRHGEEPGRQGSDGTARGEGGGMSGPERGSRAGRRRSAAEVTA